MKPKVNMGGIMSGRHKINFDSATDRNGKAGTGYCMRDSISTLINAEQ